MIIPCQLLSRLDTLNTVFIFELHVVYINQPISKSTKRRRNKNWKHIDLIFYISLHIFIR